MGSCVFLVVRQELTQTKGTQPPFCQIDEPSQFAKNGSLNQLFPGRIVRFPNLGAEEEIQTRPNEAITQRSNYLEFQLMGDRHIWRTLCTYVPVGPAVKDWIPVP